MADFGTELGRAFDASVPLVHVVSADAPAATQAIVETIGKLDDGALLYLASPLMGIEALDEDSARRMGEITSGQDAAMLSDPAALLQSIAALPVTDDAPARIVLWTGADRAWSDPGLAGALLLMRDRLPGRGVTLIGLGSGPIGGSLAGHVHTLRDALPDDAERVEIAGEILDTNDVPVGDRERNIIRNQTRGLNRFGVRQVTTLASTTGKLDVGQLTARTRETLGGLSGVSVEDALPIEALGGSDAWMRQLRLYRAASPSLVVIVDELEKVVPTMGANDSGVSSTLLGMLLGHLGKAKPIASITMGVPGTGKTLSGLVAGALYETPVVVINPGEWKQSGVGDSERNAREALAALAAFGGKQVWIGTSNGLETVPEELRDRFRGGVWYFDLPTSNELPAIWRANLARYGFDPNMPAPDLTGWSGRDVETCCLEAIDTSRDVLDVAPEIVPAARKMAARIERMRGAARAEGYRSADTGAPFTGPTAPTPATAGRTMRRRPAFTPGPVAPSDGEETF